MWGVYRYWWWLVMMVVVWVSMLVFELWVWIILGWVWWISLIRWDRVEKLWICGVFVICRLMVFFLVWWICFINNVMVWLFWWLEYVRWICWFCVNKYLIRFLMCLNMLFRFGFIINSMFNGFGYVFIIGRVIVFYGCYWL